MQRQQYINDSLGNSKTESIAEDNDEAKDNK